VRVAWECWRTAELRLQDLLQGLRQGSPIDPLFVGPRDFERLTPRLGELLSRADSVELCPESGK
jgi:hypothetical protein